MECEEDNLETSVQVMSLIYGCIPTMLARAVCELGVPDILHAAQEPLSALDIVKRVEAPSSVSPAALPETAGRLERVMRCLCVHGIFKIHVENESAAFPLAANHTFVKGEGGTAPEVCHVALAEMATDGIHVDQTNDDVAARLSKESYVAGRLDGHVEAREAVTRYCPNAVSTWLLQRPRKEDISLRGLLMFLTSPTVMMSWYQLTEYILQGGPEPFQKAHGMELWRYAHKYPDFNVLLNNAMSADTISLQALLRHYHGFASVHTLVDVGGGVGTAASHIVSVYPSLNVICFDLPHVVATAPKYPGVEFVGGDMFQNIPKGDAIFMKWILHDWSDEDCIRILKNCHKMLPKHGKVIIMDAVLEPSSEEKHTFSKIRTLIDVSMLAGTRGGKERTKVQWESILKAANFGRYKFFELPCPQCVFEAFPYYEGASYM